MNFRWYTPQDAERGQTLTRSSERHFRSHQHRLDAIAIAQCRLLSEPGVLTMPAIQTSEIGQLMRAANMLLGQLERCCAAVADDCEMVTLLDGNVRNAVDELRTTASSLAKVANEIADMAAGRH